MAPQRFDFRFALCSSEVVVASMEADANDYDDFEAAILANIDVGVPAADVGDFDDFDDFEEAILANMDGGVPPDR